MSVYETLHLMLSCTPLGRETAEAVALASVSVNGIVGKTGMPTQKPSVVWAVSTKHSRTRHQRAAHVRDDHTNLSV